MSSPRATPSPALAGPVAAREVLRLAPLVALYFVFCAIAQPGADPVRDEAALLAAAERLLDGDYAEAGAGPRAYLWHGPGLPALLAPLVALEVPLPALRFVEPALLAAATLLFHRLLRLRLAPRPALLWTYAFGLYAPFYAVLRQVHKEPLAIVLMVGAALALTRGLSGGRRRDLVAAALALAALTLVRLEYGWVLMALLASAGAWWAIAPRQVVARRMAATAAIALAACSPWLAYTHAVTGKELYWGSSAGLSLYWMSPTGPGHNGQWHSPRTVVRDPALRRYRPLFARLDTLHPLHQDRELRRLAQVNIRREPLAYARNLAANATRLLFLAPMSKPRPGIVIAGCVFFNGLLVVAVGWAGRRLWRQRRRLAPEVVPVALLAAFSLAVHLPASAQPRMLMPVVPLLLWLVAYAASRRGEDPAARWRRGLAVGVTRVSARASPTRAAARRPLG